MPTLVACLSARNHVDQPYRVPTCLAARKTIRGPKRQGNQQLISTASAQTCPLTANSGRTLAVMAGPEVRNLSELKAGDTVQVTYYESVAARLDDPRAACADRQQAYLARLDGMPMPT